MFNTFWETFSVFRFWDIYMSLQDYSICCSVMFSCVEQARGCQKLRPSRLKKEPEPGDVLLQLVLLGTDTGKKRNGDARRFQYSAAQEERIWWEQRRVGFYLSSLPWNFRNSSKNTMRSYVSIWSYFSTSLPLSHVCSRRWSDIS